MNSLQQFVLCFLGILVIFFFFAGTVSYFVAIPPTTVYSSSDHPSSFLYEPCLQDATWFSIQTITTTGYGSLPVWTTDLKIYSSFLMVFSTVTWILLLGLIVNVFHDFLKNGNQ